MSCLYGFLIDLAFRPSFFLLLSWDMPFTNRSLLYCGRFVYLIFSVHLVTVIECYLIWLEFTRSTSSFLNLSIRFNFFKTIYHNHCLETELWFSSSLSLIPLLGVQCYYFFFSRIINRTCRFIKIVRFNGLKQSSCSLNNSSFPSFL